jgi:hypothetical protein
MALFETYVCLGTDAQVYVPLVLCARVPSTDLLIANTATWYSSCCDLSNSSRRIVSSPTLVFLFGFSFTQAHAVLAVHSLVSSLNTVLLSRLTYETDYINIKIK